jgi:hypothetical protein
MHDESHESSVAVRGGIEPLASESLHALDWPNFCLAELRNGYLACVDLDTLAFDRRTNESAVKSNFRTEGLCRSGKPRLAKSPSKFARS